MKRLALLVPFAFLLIAWADLVDVKVSNQRIVPTSNVVHLVSIETIEGLCPDGCGQLNHHSRRVAVMSFQEQTWATVSSATVTQEMIVKFGDPIKMMTTNLIPRQSPYRQQTGLPPVPPLSVPMNFNATITPN